MWAVRQHFDATIEHEGHNFRNGLVCDGVARKRSGQGDVLGLQLQQLQDVNIVVAHQRYAHFNPLGFPNFGLFQQNIKIR